MKGRMRAICAFCATLLCFAPAPFAARAAVTADSTFYVIKDFYEVNWQRDWWDSGESGIAGASGSVAYSERADSMTVTYSGVYETGGKNNIMWGVNNQIARDKRDFSQGEFFASEVKNELPTPAKYQLIVSFSDRDEGSLYPRERKPYYLRSRDGTVREDTVKSAFFTVPADFEGMLLIPMDAYPDTLVRTNILRFSLGFPRGETGKLTFGRHGYADNDALLHGGEIVVKDETVYFELPDRIVIEKAPLRPVTEPETADENRTR